MNQRPLSVALNRTIAGAAAPALCARRRSLAWCCALVGLGGWLLLPLVAGTADPAGALDPSPDLEYKVKAGYLLHFARFVEWPAGAQPAPDGPFVIAVLGNEAAARTIAQVLAGKSIDGHRVEVQALAGEVVPRHAQIVFATQAAGGAPERLHRELGRAPVLLVGETECFAERGGAIGFVAEDERILLELCLRHASSGGLKISAKLASVARLVKCAAPP